MSDIKKWKNAYKKLNNDEKKYSYLLETLSSELSIQFLDDFDLIHYLISSFTYLEDAKEYEKMIELYDIAYRWKMDNEEWYYCDAYLMDYYLYNNNLTGFNNHLDSFISNPAQSLDIFIPLFDKLLYYGHTDLALDISFRLFDKVKAAPRLISGSEYQFGIIIYMQKFQDIYTDLKNNIPIGKKAIVRYLNKYDFNTKEYIDLTVDVLSPDYKELPGYDVYEKDISDLVHTLMLLFCRYMLDTKNVNFATSYEIWDIVRESFQWYIPDTKAELIFDKVFELNTERYEGEISGRLGFLSNKTTSGFGAAWGSIYVYDFLYKNEYISKKTYDHAIGGIYDLQHELIEEYTNNLWKYEFVHTWGKPDSMSDEEYTFEKDLFRTSIAQIRDESNAAKPICKS